MGTLSVVYNFKYGLGGRWS